MRFYLLYFKTHGIKNLKKDVIFNFYNETLSKDICLTNNNVKAIYGMNGSGKTAIMHSIDFLLKLIKIKNYLNSKSPDYFSCLINKEIKEYYSEIVFCSYNEKDMIVTGKFKYQIKVKISNNDNKPHIIYESLDLIKGRTINENLINLYSAENGKLSVTKDNIYAEDLKANTQNLLSDSTFLSLFFAEENSLKKTIIFDEERNDFFNSIIKTYLFALSTFVYFDNQDIHNINPKESFGSALKNLQEALEKNSFLSNNSYSSNSELMVGDNNLDIYKKETLKIEKFIKLFKPDLKKIDLIITQAYKDQNNVITYNCQRMFNYNNYSIDYGYESTGIKKLVKLYYFLNYVNLGYIVFIDELDANIHDIYLTKLIDYFSTYAKGQLCFTSHNLDPMKVLSKKKHGIDFISCSGEIVPWIKNGSSSCLLQYQNGMIQGSPFNIEPFDFLSIFGEVK